MIAREHLVRAVLERAGKPVSYRGLQVATRIKGKDLQYTLQRMEQAGAVHSTPQPGNRGNLWALAEEELPEGPDTRAEQLLEVLRRAGKPLRLSQIASEMGVPLASASDAIRKVRNRLDRVPLPSPWTSARTGWVLKNE